MSMCPPDYTMSNGTDSRYRLVTAPADFLTAARDCADDETAAPIARHTHLAVISDSGELAYLYNLGYPWVGLTDLTSPTYVWSWITDEVAMSPDPSDSALWASGEPNNPTTEHCSHFDSMKTPYVNNVTCDPSETHPYACECDAHANIPAVYGD